MANLIEIERLSERINAAIDELYAIANLRDDRNWMPDSKVNLRIGWLKGLCAAKEQLLPNWFGGSNGEHL